MGCTRYPYLSGKDLEGPVRDVELLADLLTGERFGLSPDRVVTLAGWPDDETARPTRANIVRELQRLGREARRGEQVVIVLAGHGSQQPADDDPADLEPDGLDEIFLPADVRGWDGERKTVEHALVDDEIRRFVAAIRARGAFVWLIVDSCHSGTMTRGGAERARYVAPEELLGPGARSANAARSRGPRAGDRAVQTLDLHAEGEAAGGLVALYASQAGEQTYEAQIPEAGDPYRGIFSFTLASVLASRPRALTYRELAQEVARLYRSRGRTHPTPLVEGEIDREVLGLAEWPGRSRFRLAGHRPEEGGRWRIAAGALHGLTRGSVLAVHPPAGSEDADRLLGHLRLVAVEPTEALAEPATRGEDGAWRKATAEALPELDPSFRLEVAFVDYGDLRMGVGVQTQAEPGGEILDHAPRTGPPVLERAVADLAERAGALVERAATPEAADWFVRRVGEDVVLVPSAGWSARDGVATPSAVPPAFAAGSAEGGDPLVAQLARSLRRIARAHNLLGLDSAGRARPPGSIDVEVDVVPTAPAEGGASRATRHRAAELALSPGEEGVFRISNPTRSPIDVTLLFIDGSYGIQSLFPSTNQADNRLGPGESLDVFPFRVTADTVGTEHVVALAVPGTGETRTDFRWLEQERLRRLRTRGERQARSPLHRLLEDAAFEGTRRSLEPQPPERWAVRVRSWITLSRGDDGS